MAAAMLCLAAAPATADDPPRKSVAAHRAQEPPVLDGRLDDLVWQQASFVEDLHIVVSDEYGAPAERSRIYVAFDDDNLYFAARFWDSRPETIVAKVLNKKDVSFGEDGFTVTLDPFDQGRTGYAFDVNPNGMRSEAIYTDTDRQNWDWEGIWYAAARQDAEGWTAESVDPAEDAVLRSVARRLGRQLHALARHGQRAVRLGLVQSQPGSLAHGSHDGPRRTAAGPRHRRDPRPAHRRDA